MTEVFEMKKKIISYLEIIIGNMLSACAFGMIVLPQKFVAGGVTGLSLVLSHVFPIHITIIMYIINAILFALGFFLVGREFVMKTLLSSVIFPLFLGIASTCTWLAPLSRDPFLSAIIGGLLLGLGSGLVLYGDGSSGGFDILGVIAHQYFHVPVAAVTCVCDSTVILLQLLMAHDIMKTAYGIVVIVCCSLIINRVLSAGAAKSQMVIISRDYELIRKELLTHQDVGLTLINAESGYLSSSIKVILAVMPYEKIAATKKAVNIIDPTAFVIISDVHSVLGKGYTLNRYM